MRTVGIGLKAASYTPEAYAYASYLESHGVRVQLVDESLLHEDNDINIYFMGLRPFYNKKRGVSLEIHEYQSLSTPPCSHVKDFVKSKLNSKPAGRIFLNEIVSNRLSFNDSIRFIHRDMGVDRDIFQEPSSDPEYDIVYCGSITGRPGLIEEIERLATHGFSLLIIGLVSPDILSRLSYFDNIKFAGRVKRSELPELYSKCRAGLNYTPNLYPFNLQTSTKTLEYLAAGLGLVSNRYMWVEDFCVKYKIDVLWTDMLKSPLQLRSTDSWAGDVSIFEWDAVLERAGFLDFLKVVYLENK